MEQISIQRAQQFKEERFTKVDMIKKEKSVVFMLNFLPGQIMKAHHHPNKELYLFIVEGNGTFSFDGEEVPVKQGDLLHCHAEEKLGFVNTSDERVSIYATMTKLT